MQKVFVAVQCSVDPDGIIMPSSILWVDGRCWSIKKVLHTCTASHYEFEGIRYRQPGGISACAAGTSKAKQQKEGVPKYRHRAGQI